MVKNEFYIYIFCKKHFVMGKIFFFKKNLFFWWKKIFFFIIG